MELRVYHVHAFAAASHGGSPAGVCLHHDEVAEDALRRIARDLGPSVTAFLGVGDRSRRALRWFTREGAEVQSYCGHATFAAAHVLLDDDGAWVDLDTISGVRRATRVGQEIVLEIPAWEAAEEDCPSEVTAAIGHAPSTFLRGARDCLLLYPDAPSIAALKPDFAAMFALGDVGFICAAQGEMEGEVVFRFFCPGFNIGEDEDPATGSAHSTLAPFWLDRLGRNTLITRQLSHRGATFTVAREEGRMTVAAPCATFLEGIVYI